MIKFHIITRCTRLKDLATIKASIEIHHNIDKQWHIVFDTAALTSISTDLLENLQASGTKLHFMYGGKSTLLYPHISKLITTLEDGYVILLDDDNTLHPRYFQKISEAIKSNLDKKIFVTAQLVDKKDFTGLTIRNAAPEHTKYQHIDAAQMTIHTSVFNNFSFIADYAADGYFAEDVYRNHPEWFYYLDEVLCYYNRLS